jgi:putative aldouronate transport system substrate-binding protein
MSKSFRRAAALGLTVVMSLSLFGCGSKKQEQVDATTVSTTAPVESTAEATKAKEPVTLRIFGPVFYGGPWQNGVADDPIAEIIKKDTGITMDIEHVDDTNYETKLSAMIAGGDLPDIVGMKARNHLDTLIQNNQILALDDLVASNGPNITKYTPQKLSFSKKFMSSGTDKLYILPSNLSNSSLQGIHSPFWVLRWDLYKQLGYPEYKDMYEFLNVLKKMQDLEPKNVDGKKVFGLSGWFADWGLWNQTILASELGYYSELPGLLDFDMETNAVRSYILDDNGSFWQSMKWWYTANKMGLMDPESVTQKFDQTKTKGAANRILCAPFDWALGEGRAAFAKDGHPEKDYVNAPPPTGQTRKRGGDANPYGQMGELYAVSSNCKTPDRAVDLINWFYDPMNCVQVMVGAKGDTWDIEDGKPVMKDAYFTEKPTDPQYELKRGINKYGGFKGMNDGFVNPDNNTQLAMWTTDKWRQFDLNPAQHPATADLLDHYKVKFPLELAKNVKMLTWNGTIKGMLPEGSDEIKLIQSNVDTYLLESSPKLALAKNDAEFEAIAKEIKEKCKAIGIEKLSDFWIKEVNNVVSQLDSIK